MKSKILLSLFLLISLCFQAAWLGEDEEKNPNLGESIEEEVIDSDHHHDEDNSDDEDDTHHQHHAGCRHKQRHSPKTHHQDL